MAGEYESAFRGRGMEFEEVREYKPGDDIRSIDWNVTARMGNPFVKIYREERELTVMLLVDVSFSGRFGTVSRFKNELSAEIAAVIAYLAIRNNDRVGLLIFSDRVEKFLPPKKGKSYVWRVIREVLSYTPKHKGTDIGVALDFLNRVMNRKAICFLISDFLTAGYERHLKITNKEHDLIAITVTDPKETKLPEVGLVEMEDTETGENILIDTDDYMFRKGFDSLVKSELAQRENLFKSINLDSINIRTDTSYIYPIIKFFKMREKRMI
ncbi:MAG: hypothetical protein A2W05_05950 [Candidatus Schekmanbacteria bacterium RBG_16_38_10]|uniref:DUF58 domain-containing protein n=1 Tax=Candidatus Schekmanbacteria bacterium RBG_16_38_10 TaxID=1817879 RepID=A0A1F7RPV8_9BACT|nr:MAG: hypothetical protein A2W05_05950 [Candidatus Schekmanbacteria bacterium RBG_16_38_10]